MATEAFSDGFIEFDDNIEPALIEKLLTELEQEDAFTHDKVLANIRYLSRLAAEIGRACTGSRVQIGTVRPRNWWRFLPIDRRREHVWWLGLYHPLWLGNDGKIYREYEGLTGKSYYMEAEIWLRDERGLKHIEAALFEFIRKHSPTA